MLELTRVLSNKDCHSRPEHMACIGEPIIKVIGFVVMRELVKQNADHSLWIRAQADQAGHQTICQAADFRVGDDFVEKIHDALKTSDAVIQADRGGRRGRSGRGSP